MAQILPEDWEPERQATISEDTDVLRPPQASVGLQPVLGLLGPSTSDSAVKASASSPAPHLGLECSGEHPIVCWKSSDQQMV